MKARLLRDTAHGVAQTFAMALRKLLAPTLLLGACAALVLVLLRELRAHPGLLGIMNASTVGLLIVWLLLEAPLSARLASDDEKGEDRGTVRLNALTRAAALVAALALPSRWTGWGAAQSAGLVLFVAGFTLRLAAIRQLGRFYSHKVRRAEGHQIIRGGPYRLVRHPAYLGVLAAHLGFALVFLNPFSVLAVLLLVTPAFVWRIKVEEPVLMAIPGYPEYARTHARLIPRLW
jgi:protein-S-isoprenylcysteine O-methyltransferase Ste14